MNRELLRGALAALALAMVFEAVAQTRPLNDTGQIACYNATASTGTVGVGTPDPESAGFNEQDCTRGRAAADAVGVLSKVGASSVPGRDYTKIANDGSELPADAALGTGPGDWGCARDNVTGLIWEIKTADGGLRDKDHTYSWYDIDAAVNGGNAGFIGGGSACGNTLAGCNTSAFRDAVNGQPGASRLCGATDWRLPKANELQSLVHFGGTFPSIDVTYFPDTLHDGYWTGLNCAFQPTSGWIIDFTSGRIRYDGKGSGLRVRLVRGG